MRIGPFGSAVLLGGPLVFLAIFFIVPFGWLALDSFQRGVLRWALAVGALTVCPLTVGALRLVAFTLVALIL